MNGRLTQRRICGIWAAGSPVERVPSYAAYVLVRVKTLSRHYIVRGERLDGVSGVWTGRLRGPVIFTPPVGLLTVKVDDSPIVPTAQDRRCGGWIEEGRGP